jgi:hypothetical protein
MIDQRLQRAEGGRGLPRPPSSRGFRCGWPGRAQNLGDGFSVRLPCFRFGAKVKAALARQLVILRFPIVVREAPFRFNEAFAFEAPKCGVKRAFFDQEGFVTLAADEARDRVAVQRAPDKGLEDKDIQGAAYEFQASLFQVCLRSP